MATKTTSASFYIAKAIESIKNIENYSKNISSLKGLEKDRLRRDAIIRNLEIIGEAIKNLPETSNVKTERFEMPKVRGHIQGNKTIISNFNQVANILGCEKQHFLKYLLKELATPGSLKPSGLVLATKVPASRINEKIK